MPTKDELTAQNKNLAAQVAALQKQAADREAAAEQSEALLT